MLFKAFQFSSFFITKFQSLARFVGLPISNYIFVLLRAQTLFKIHFRNI